METGAVDQNGNADYADDTKGLAELSSPLTSPIGERHGMNIPSGQVHEIDSGCTGLQGDTKFSKLDGNEHAPVELPAEAVVYEKQ